MTIRQVRADKIIKSWAQEFWLLRRREKVRVILLSAILGVMTWHMITPYMGP